MLTFGSFYPSLSFGNTTLIQSSLATAKVAKYMSTPNVPVRERAPFFRFRLEKKKAPEQWSVPIGTIGRRRKVCRCPGTQSGPSVFLLLLFSVLLPNTSLGPLGWTCGSESELETLRTMRGPLAQRLLRCVAEQHKLLLLVLPSTGKEIIFFFITKK